MSNELSKGSSAARRWAIILAIALSSLGQFTAFLQIHKWTISTPSHLETHEQQSPISSVAGAYRLSPGAEADAHRLYSSTALYFFSERLYEISLLALVLKHQWISRMSDRAKAGNETIWGQAWSVVPKAILFSLLLLLPSQAFAHYFQCKVGVRATEWPEWSTAYFLDAAGGLVVLPIIVWMFYVTVRKSPRWWWLFLSVIALVLSPLSDYWSASRHPEQYFYLEAEHPQLVDTIQALAARDGLQIPRYDIGVKFAKDSDFLGRLNAHVSGIGAQRRIVISSSAIEKLNADQLSFIAAHEIAHYRYNHAAQDIVFSALLLIPLIYLCFRLINYLHGRWGIRWGIPNLDDLASLPLFLLVFSLVFEVGDVAGNVYSWHQESQADRYAVELINGVVANPNQAAAQALQKLGEDSLEYPNPCPLVHIFLSDHPPISSRVHSVLQYVPSKKGDKRSLKGAGS